MDNNEKQVLEQITKNLTKMLRGKKTELITSDGCPESLKELTSLMNEIFYSYSEIWNFILPLSKGMLNIDPPKAGNVLASPFKELHSQMRTLIWQVQRIAEGDYKQRVDFMGDFSLAFNSIVQSLEEKRRDFLKDRERIEENLRYLASHDSLTRVPNRSYLEETYLERFSGFSNVKKTGALLIIDVDNFKFINDTFGHTVGDMVLVDLVSKIKQNIHEESLIARLSGDEFVVLLSDVTEEEAVSFSEKLRQSVEETKLYPDNSPITVSYTISIGIVPIHDEVMDFREVISRADYALQQSKEQGRNCIFCASDEHIHTVKKEETNKLLFMINNAIEQNKIVLYFQPIVNISTGEILHHEALMRIVTDSGEIVGPNKIIPIAERFGLMSQIDRCVVRLCFDALEKYPELNLFINLSAVSIGDEKLLSYLEESIKLKGIDPTRIGFEITETMAVKDLARADRWIRRLREKGCKFALDDFGIGFSSFSYLQYLSVDYVKIDGSFVKDVDKNSKNRAMVQAMNTVVRSFGKETIAEFVESSSILDILGEDQIGHAQGYYLGLPEPIPRFKIMSSV